MVYVLRAVIPPSRPCPDSLKPPKGSLTSESRTSFIHNLPYLAFRTNVSCSSLSFESSTPASPGFVNLDDISNSS